MATCYRNIEWLFKIIKLSKSKRINGHSFNFGPKNNEIISVNKILKYISKDWPSFQWVKSNNIIKMRLIY